MAQDPPPLDLPDIQGLLLRGYRYPRARFFVLQVGAAPAARRWVGSLLGASAGALQVTSAQPWPEQKPTYCLNVGFTQPGLGALLLGEFDFGSFPSFVAGAAARATAVGDTGVSAPAQWIGSLGSGRDHAIVALYAIDAAELAQRSAELRAGFAQGDGLRELLAFDAAALPGEKVHFGYRDGITQPTIAGGPERPFADAQPPSPAWNFVLLDDPDRGYRLPEPRWLGLNGSFGVFRILRQDVVGFERFLQAQPDMIDPELLAAKLCGRWRNGTPLALCPDAASAQSGVPEDDLNRFDYVAVEDDSAGLRCPLGAHIRRVNPRSTAVTGGGGHLHRIIRRGLPYGPAYDPSLPDDGLERGLAGFFINASIENQYEFVVRKWMNEGGFAAGLSTGSKDGITGDNDPSTSRFEIPIAGRAPLRVPGLARFVQTRGGAYCFLPSLSALRAIAAL